MPTNVDGSPVADIDTNSDGIYSDEEYAAEAAFQAGGGTASNGFTPYTPPADVEAPPQPQPEGAAPGEQVNDLKSLGIGVGQAAYDAGTRAKP